MFMLHVRFDFRLDFLTFVDSKFSSSSGARRQRESGIPLGFFNMKSNLTCNIYNYMYGIEDELLKVMVEEFF